MMTFGGRVYGPGAFILGVVGLVGGDFALVWQPVPACPDIQRWPMRPAPP
jgi:hypothetical protein